MMRDLGGSKARRGGDEAIAFPGPKIPRVYSQVIWSWGHRRTHAHTHASGGGAETKKKESYTACQVHTNHAQRKCKITQTSKIDDTATHKAAHIINQQQL